MFKILNAVARFVVDVVRGYGNANAAEVRFPVGR